MAEPHRQVNRANKPRDRFVPRFAGEAFSRQNNAPDGPDLRKLASEVAWKRPPNTELSQDSF